ADFYDRIKDQDTIKFTDPVFAAKWNDYENGVLNIVKSNPGNYYTLLTLMQRCSSISNFTLSKCYQALTNDSKATVEGQYIKNYIATSSKLYKGNKIHFFNVANKEGKPVEFKKLLSKKYYFLDFWASWCKPCREKMQELKQVYVKVDTGKLQFISLSIDIKKEQWLAALKEDDLKWVNYIQADKKANNLLLLFNLDSIPQNILINNDGEIIDRNLSIANLNKFIIDNSVVVNKQLVRHDYITAVK
ncbi:MAG: thioredoxin family protein, partial [Mucilaginibacter sp.]